MNRDMLSRRLSRRGYEVLVSEDGSQGIQVASAEHPDLILMDLSLPVIDGWQATATLRAQPSTRDIPIIALTAHAMRDDSRRALEAGCDDYDTKPVELDRLIGKIDALIGEAR
jgi:CheY-like chemotaxis protein